MYHKSYQSFSFGIFWLWLWIKLWSDYNVSLSACWENIYQESEFSLSVREGLDLIPVAIEFGLEGGSGMWAYPGSEFFYPGSWVKRASDPFISNLSLKIVTRQSSRKYDPGCLSRIWIFFPSRIQGGSIKHPIPDPDPQHRRLRWLVCLGAISVEDEDGRVIKLDPEDQALRTMVANTLLTPSYREKWVLQLQNTISVVDPE